MESRGKPRVTPEQVRARGTKEPGGGSGMTVHNRDEEDRSHGGADGSKGRGEVQGLVAGGGDRLCLCQGGTRDW